MQLVSRHSHCDSTRVPCCLHTSIHTLEVHVFIQSLALSPCCPLSLASLFLNGHMLCAHWYVTTWCCILSHCTSPHLIPLLCFVHCSNILLGATHHCSMLDIRHLVGRKVAQRPLSFLPAMSFPFAIPRFSFLASAHSPLSLSPPSPHLTALELDRAAHLSAHPTP